jgi:transposase
MQGRQEISPKLYYQVTLYDLVPEDNFYRKLGESLDLRYLYKATAKYYGYEGQESIDPIVFFKILLVGYLNNINSDRKLIEYCSNCLDVRLFLKYDLDEALPWHSTISRTRQLYGEEVFLSLFQQILALCVQKGMVRGKRQAVDAAFIKANASMDSLVEKEVVADASAYVSELEEGSEYKVTSTRKKLVEQQHDWQKEEYKDMPAATKSDKIDENGNLIRPKFLSNHTHYSPTDPDAKISVKPGKARQLNYSGQIAVDDAHHVITGAVASTAGSKDSENLAEIVDQTIENLKQNNITIDQIAADAGYSSGKALKYCEDNNIDAYIPNFGQYKPYRTGFVYDKRADQYICTQAGGNNAKLLYKGIKTDARGYEFKNYRSSESDCKNCPLREACCGKSTKFKKLVESVYKPYYDRMHQKLKANQQYTNAIVRKRSSTVEPVLGTLINFLNMKKINSRGMAQANKHVLMAATVYNLKKLLKFDRKNPTINAQEMPKMAENLLDLLKTLKYGLHILFISLANFNFPQARKISIVP